MDRYRRRQRAARLRGDQPPGRLVGPGALGAGLPRAATRASSSGGCRASPSLIAAHEIPATFAFSVEEGTATLPLERRPAASPVADCEWSRRLGDLLFELDGALERAGARRLRPGAGRAGRLPGPAPTRRASAPGWARSTWGRGRAASALALARARARRRQSRALDVRRSRGGAGGARPRADAAAAWSDVAARAGRFAPRRPRPRPRGRRTERGSDRSCARRLARGPSEGPATWQGRLSGATLEGAAVELRDSPEPGAEVDRPDGDRATSRSGRTRVGRPRRRTFQCSGAVPESERSSPVPSAAEKPSRAWSASAPSPASQALDQAAARRPRRDRRRRRARRSRWPCRPADWASANSAATNDGTSAGSPRGTSESGPNAARATVPSRSVKPWLPMIEARSLTVADVKACKVGRPSDASVTGTCQPGPELGPGQRVRHGVARRSLPPARRSASRRAGCCRGARPRRRRSPGARPAAPAAGCRRGPSTQRVEALVAARRRARSGSRWAPPSPSVSGTPRRRRWRRPAAFAAGAAAGTQSSGSACVAGERASTVQSSQSCGRIERAVGEIGPRRGERRGGRQRRREHQVDVTVYVPTRIGRRRRRAAARPRPFRPASRLEPGMSTQPLATTAVAASAPRRSPRDHGRARRT